MWPLLRNGFLYRYLLENLCTVVNIVTIRLILDVHAHYVRKTAYFEIRSIRHQITFKIE